MFVHVFQARSMKNRFRLRRCKANNPLRVHFIIRNDVDLVPPHWCLVVTGQVMRRCFEAWSGHGRTGGHALRRLKAKNPGKSIPFICGRFGDKVEQRTRLRFLRIRTKATSNLAGLVPGYKNKFAHVFRGAEYLCWEFRASC
jgi:hypothetical protein